MCTLIFFLFSCKEWSKGCLLFGAPSRCPPLPKGVQGVHERGEEIEIGHAGARVTNKHLPPGAVDGRLGQAWEEAEE